MDPSQFPWAFWVAITGLVGLMVGSFLNVVIHRLPIMMERQWRAEYDAIDPKSGVEVGPAPYNLATPRSACPACHTPIRAIHNIPVLSWLFLRGRCASCRAPISARYPIVELLTGVLSVAIVLRFGPSVESALGLGVTCTLIALAGIDLDTQLLPDQLTLPLMWAGLLAAAFLGRGQAPFPVDLKSAVLGAAFGYLSLWLVYHAFKATTGKEGMGYGDFKLLAALGAWLGWQLLLPVLLFSAGVGALTGGSLILLRRHAREVPIPFGPYLAAAGWAVMVGYRPLVASWWPWMP
jgi:leader peptidase (prepilin peptidase)/N-methyltransferase